MTKISLLAFDDLVAVPYGRCAHRGALMADGYVDGDKLICGLHSWDYRIQTGVSEYNNSETLHRFGSRIEDGEVRVDSEEIRDWAKAHPQPYKRNAYQGAYQDPTGTGDEPHDRFIRKLGGAGICSGEGGMRACHTNNCPVGIATQKPALRARLPIDEAARRLARFFGAAVELMTVLARACGHDHLGKFDLTDLTTFSSDMARLTGITYGGVHGP